MKKFTFLKMLGILWNNSGLSLAAVMPWESLKLLNRSGHPLTGCQREIILKGVEKALASPYVKLETVLRTAVNVARNIDCAKDPRAYTSRSFFRVDRNARIAARKEANLTEQLGPHHLNSQAASLRVVEPIEQQVLIRELLEQLDGLEREIYLARLSGDSFKKIDKTLSLKPGTSEDRYRKAKYRLSKGYSRSD